MRQALIVRGGWEGHRPVETTEMFAPFLRAQGFGIRVEETPGIYADAAAMADVDLIVQAVSMSEISSEQVAGLRDAIQAGAGLVGWHGGIVDSYRASPEYLQLVGGQFVAHPGAHPGDPTRGHPTHDIVFTDAGRTHPVTAGLEDFSLTTEQYWVLHDDLIDVLATTVLSSGPGRPWHRPVVSPAVWTREWGAGRVAVATPGHDTDVLAHPSVGSIVERAMLWAARPAAS